MGKVKTSSTKTTEFKVATVPRGKPKSGRVWKNQKQRLDILHLWIFNKLEIFISLPHFVNLLYFFYRTSTVRKHKRDSFEKKQELRQQLKDTKEKSRSIIEQKKIQQQLKREREAVNKKRKEENAKKSEVVQVVRNIHLLNYCYLQITIVVSGLN